MVRDPPPLCIKLYFKQTAAAKNRLVVMLHLLDVELPERAKEAIPAILDGPRGKLVRPTAPKSGLDALLTGEPQRFPRCTEPLARLEY